MELAQKQHLQEQQQEGRQYSNMPIQQSLLDKITGFEGEGYTPDEIVSGLGTSENFPDIAQKVQGYQNEGFSSDDILSGIRSAEIAPAEGLGIKTKDIGLEKDLPVSDSIGIPKLRPKPEEAAGRELLPGAPEERTFIETIGAGLRRGAIGEGVGIGKGVEFLGDVIGSETVATLGEDLATFSEGVLRRHPEWAAAKEQSERAWFHPERLAETVAEAIPMMATFLIPGGLAAKGLRLAGATAKAARTAGAVISGTPFGVVSAGEMYDEALRAGVDQSTAKWLAGTAGVLEVGLELYGAGKLIELMGLDKLGKEGIRQAVTKVEALKNIARSAGEIAKVEALEEFSQTVKDNVIKKYGIDEGQEIFEGGLQSFVVGGIMGGLLGGGGRAFTEFTARPEETPSAVAQTIVTGLVKDKVVSVDQGQSIIEEFGNTITEEMSPEENSEVLENILGEIGIEGFRSLKEDTLPEAEIIPETTEERVAATTEDIKTKVTETLDAIEPQTEVAAKVKDLLKEEVTKIVTAPVIEEVLPEAEIIGEELVSPREQAYIDAAVSLGVDTQGKTADQIIDEVSFAIEEQGLTEAEILPEEIITEPVREAPEVIPTAAIEPSLPEAAPPVTPEVAIEEVPVEPVVEPTLVEAITPIEVPLAPEAITPVEAVSSVIQEGDILTRGVKPYKTERAAMNAIQARGLEGYEAVELESGEWVGRTIAPIPEAIPRAEEQIGLPIDTGKAELPITPLRGKQADRFEIIDRAKEVEAEKVQVTVEEAIAKKTLPVEAKGVIFNEEEIKRRIKDGYYYHDTIPAEATKAIEGSPLEAASSIARGSLRAVPEKDAIDYSEIKNPDRKREVAGSIREAESTALKEWVDQNDQLVLDFVTKQEEARQEGIEGGRENYVYRDTDSGRWVKANRLTHTPTYSEMFDRVMLHNELFPNAAYQYEGFAEIDGELLPVFSQEHIQETEVIDDTELEALASKTLEEMGFVVETDFPGDVTATKFVHPSGVVVFDISARNVAYVNGEVVFVDPIIEMDPETKQDRVGKPPVDEIEATPLKIIKDKLKAGDFNDYLEREGFTLNSAEVALKRAEEGRFMAPIQEKILKGLQNEIAGVKPKKAAKKVDEALPVERVRIGSSPQAYEVVRELEASAEEVELGERFFEVRNEKTGDIQTVSFEEMKPIKKRVVSEKAKEEAKATIKKKLGRITAGVDPTLLKEYAVIGAFHIESGLIKIGEWSRQMISEFGDGIKPYLTRIFKQAKTMVPEEAEVAKAREAIKAKAVPKPEKKAEEVKPALSRVEEFRKKFEEGTRRDVTEEESFDNARKIDAPASKAAKGIKRWAKRNFTKEGLTNKKAFESRIEMDAAKNAGEADIAAMVVDFEKAMTQAFNVKRYNNIPAEDLEKANTYLAGEPVILPENLKKNLDHLRSTLDRLSDGMLQSIKDMEAIERTKLSDSDQKKLDALKAGTGTEVPVSLQRYWELYNIIVNNKGTYLTRSYQAFDDPKWQDTVLKKKGVVKRAEDFIRVNNPGLTENEVQGSVDAILQEAIDAGTMTALISRGTKIGTKDVSILTKRKDVPPAIRELLGEFKDPKLNFVRSASKMQHYIANHNFLMRIRSEGLGTFLFEKPTRLGGESYSSRVASKGTETYNPLNGLYTTKDFKQGLEDASDGFTGSELMRNIIRVNSFVKYGKTILAPTTQARNLMSAAMFTVMNGHFNWSEMAKAGKASWADLFTKDKEWRAYLNKLIKLGVMHDTPFAGELRDAIKDFTELDVYSKGPGQNFNRILDFMQNTYRLGDDFWKIIGYENELADWKKAGLSQAEAEKKAAFRIRNGYPTYSMVPRGIKQIRRWPLIGTFVSFPYEIVRTTVNQLNFIKEDMKDPKTRPMAYKRALGFAAASGVSYAASIASMTLMGMDADDDEAMRAQLPPWSRNSQLYYTGFDDNGLPLYLDLSYIDPYTYLKKPLTALLSGNNKGIDKKIEDAMRELLEPFVGPDIAARAVGELIFNQKFDGGEVYNPEDQGFDKAVSIMDHIRKATQPGILSNIERTVKAINSDISRTGKTYSLKDEGLAWVGFRFGTLNLAQSLIYKGYGFRDRKVKATRILDFTVGSASKTSDAKIKSSVLSMVRAREKAYNDMIKLVSGAKKLGTDNFTIRRSLRASGVSKEDIGFLIRGRVPRWRIKPTFLRNATKRALASAPNADRRRELLQEMVSRKRIVRKALVEAYR
ncbi:MAG: hypothetical protein V3U97_03230 [bacterium]